MKVYGLYGKSGTGKSYKSSEIIALYQIDAVVDDGILIMGKQRVAGKSAKNERTAYAATKTAIFFTDAHRLQVYNYIVRSGIKKILVIGTSKKMVEKIAQRLNLPSAIEWLPIESFQSEEELKLAGERRRIGYHVIPILPDDVEKTYVGWFSKQTIYFGKQREEVILVKPAFSRDKITIYPQCIRDIVTLSADPMLQVHSIQVDRNKVFIKLSLQRGCSIESLQNWKEHVTAVLHYSLNISYEVNIAWMSIHKEKINKPEQARRRLK
ncbi:hypothetical protein [Paenibacillus sp. P36]|uniref:hypothetical protein n=1 Tax=Paenibacillus sp. P36 TaxID=3342538 RepID=UPI0038B2B2E5